MASEGLGRDREPFFNRRAEIRQLEAIWSAPGAQFVTLWGRRRVGKSALLSRFADGKPSVYLYGTRIAEAEILRSLAYQVAATSACSRSRVSWRWRPTGRLYGFWPAAPASRRAYASEPPGVTCCSSSRRTYTGKSAE
jgi:hypothetical protein